MAPHKHPSSFPLVYLAPKSLLWLLNLPGAQELSPNTNKSVRLHRVELKLHPQSPSALFIVPVLGLQGKHQLLCRLQKQCPHPGSALGGLSSTP